MCHEWRLSGGIAKAKAKGTVAMGYYSRLEWPEPGGVMKQCNILVEIFNIIDDEKYKQQNDRMA
ncbi:MAG: hypothetical protein JRC86_12845 [Deltaproteobacteria bacterium]|nr:hypothetical protein [Deltaproteobacteria bacterium]